MFLKYWTGLQNGSDKKISLEGAENLQATALEAHRTAARRGMLMIAETGENSDG
jgi:hypothetical protein